MTTIKVKKACTASFCIKDQEQSEILHRILFAGDEAPYFNIVELSFDPEINELQISIEFTDGGGEVVGSITTWMTMSYELAGILHIIATPTVKHMIKEG